MLYSEYLKELNDKLAAIGLGDVIDNVSISTEMDEKADSKEELTRLRSITTCYPNKDTHKYLFAKTKDGKRTKVYEIYNGYNGMRVLLPVVARKVVIKRYD